jgi:hypothetical protein
MDRLDKARKALVENKVLRVLTILCVLSILVLLIPSATLEPVMNFEWKSRKLGK